MDSEIQLAQDLVALDAVFSPNGEQRNAESEKETKIYSKLILFYFKKMKTQCIVKYRFFLIITV